MNRKANLTIGELIETITADKRRFEVYLRLDTGDYEFAACVEVLGSASPEHALELYGAQQETDWHCGGDWSRPAYEYLIQEVGSKSIYAFTVKPRRAFRIERAHA